MPKPIFSQALRTLLLFTMSLTACTGASQTGGAIGAARSEGSNPGEITLTLGAYTTPREAYGEIIPLFQEYWKEQSGQTVTFEASYLGSGAQSRAVVEGFEADIVVLSLEADVNRIADAGLITHDWKALPNNGMISTSIAVMAVREGNPKGITDWVDLVQDGIEILTPDPRTSGGAQWNVLAIYGAADRGRVAGYPAGEEGARTLLKDIFRNVTALDKSARDSITNYEQGVGDVAITYENEVLVGQQAGQTYEYVMPTSTILIENPVAVVDTYVDEHGTREVAQAFRDFLWTADVQRIFARHGLRPVLPEVATEVAEQYPPVTDLFTIEHFGGWGNVTQPFFGDDGLFLQIMEEIQRGD
ncbi:MAG: sulfate ABC transporter substrate-binding protein [Ardenticatenaceae bacterium]